MKVDNNIQQIDTFSRVSIWSTIYLFIFLNRFRELLIKSSKLLWIILLIFNSWISWNGIWFINSTLVICNPLVWFIEHLNGIQAIVLLLLVVMHISLIVLICTRTSSLFSTNWLEILGLALIRSQIDIGMIPLASFLLS